MFAEITAWAKELGKMLYKLLMEIYKIFGFYKEHMISLTLKGKEGTEQIAQMMKKYRQNPPAKIDGSPVKTIHDYEKQETTDVSSSGKISRINQPKSDVLQFITEDGTKVSVRPSGTEPKIKFYFGVKNKLKSAAELGNQLKELDGKIARIAEELGIKK